jgi:putative nucleotidyltransferase with HDIG domain
MQHYSDLRRIVRGRLEKWPPKREGYHWPGYTWDHTLRVINLSVSMAQHAGADKRTIRYAALLHDIAKPAGDDHARIGARKAREVLEEHDFHPDFIERITSAVATHAGGTCPEDPLENRLLSDADFIDANFGLVGAWRFITIRGGRGEPLDEIVAGMAEWLDKKEELAGRLVTDLGADIAAERMRRMEAFCAVLQDHYDGDPKGLPPQVWFAGFIHRQARSGRMMQQLQSLSDIGDRHLPNGVTPLIRRLSQEIDGAK